MLSFWFIPALILNVIFMTLIGVNWLQPYDSSALENLLASIEGCESICWLDIRPGYSTLPTLQGTLSHHEWVGGQEFNPSIRPNSGALVWTWNLPPDVPIDPTRRGIAGLQVGIVSYIQLPTNLTFGEFWLARGQPLSGQTLGLGSGQFPNSLRHYVAYDAGGTLQVRTIVQCPFSSVALWHAPVDVWLGSESDIALAPYTLPTAATCNRS